MSLIGSLEDLGLGDILQIISLSQKSGVLVIRSEEGEGRILLRDGQVRGAVVKGGPHDLRAVLVSGGFLSEDQFESAEARALTEGVDIEDAIAAQTDLSAERIDSLRRESVESAVVRMFRWRVGEFSFDVRESPDPEDPPLLLPVGINAQYLAMEGSRLDDECGRGTELEPDDGVDDGGEEMSAHEMFGVEPEEPDEVELPSATQTVDEGVLEAVPIDSEEDLEAIELVEAAPVVPEPVPVPVLEVEPLDVDPAPALETEALDVDPDPALETPASGPEKAVERPPREPASSSEAAPTGELLADVSIVAIDPDLAALEWVKQSLTDAVSKVHIFQRAEQGLGRIRQYLTRGENPVVLLSPKIPGDRLSGIADARDFARRLKAQGRRMRVLWLWEDGGEPQASPAPADGVVVRPASYQFSNRGAAGQLATLSERLLADLHGELSRSSVQTAPRAPSGISPEALQNLKHATASLADASSRGEVLPLVIRFANESFDRVAMFMVREGQVMGMAGRGLEQAGGPDDAGLRAVGCEARSCSWFQEVLDTHRALRAPPRGAGDEALAHQLGDRIPDEVYLAPIESAGQVVALLYGDNLPGGRPIPDTSALEVVLHQAGLALDRAALERALAEA